MAEANVFVDTGGIFSVLCHSDSAHVRATAWLQESAAVSRRAWISDYVLDETATLLKSRRMGHLNRELFRMVDSTDALQLIFVDSDRFHRAREFFLKHLDQGYSFTDCTSFEIMRELKLKEALTTDQHFREAGFTPLLA